MIARGAGRWTASSPCLCSRLLALRTVAGCELAFRHMGHMNWQMQLTHCVDTLPITRDWMFAAEARAACRTETATGPVIPR
jgi:hypothetical protein